MKHAGTELGQLDVYPVGLLRDVQMVVHAPRANRRKAVQHLTFWFRRSWRRRSYWNGYLCEPAVHDGTWTRCGHGWTRGRAYDDLMRHIEGER